MNWKRVAVYVGLSVLVVAVLLLAGFGIYRVGFRQGVTAARMQSFGMQTAPGGKLPFDRGVNQMPGNPPYGGQTPLRENKIASVNRVGWLPLLVLGVLILGAGAVSGLVGGLVMRSASRSREVEVVEAEVEEEAVKPKRSKR